MTNRAIRDLSTFFVLLFATLAIRQIYVQLVAAPAISARATNPRHALLDVGRGRILATDGTVLAETVAGKRVYPLGAELAQSVGYASARYGTSGIEGSFDRALTSPDFSGDPLAQLGQLAASLRGSRDRRRGADVVTTIVPPVANKTFRIALAVPARSGRRARSAHGRGPRACERAELRSQRFRCGVSLVERRSGIAAARSRGRRTLSPRLDF